ncbi:orotate phosphoribosyltransferase [bacterium]|nr:MAG: orotate phosphoribosyltransferase [bacterium]RKZ24002.1 MAG: orotate phosphoribosyltransferase [bacterium]
MQNYEELFEKLGVIKQGHFLLTSGLHSGTYFEKFRLLEHPRVVEGLVRDMLSPFLNEKIDWVVGPTLGGALLAFEAGRQLGVPAAYAEREGEGRILKRGFEVRGRVIVIDDVLTTGKSIKETLEMLENYPVEVVGVSVVVDRSEKEVSFGVPLHSLLRKPTANYKPEECPLCKKGIPLVKPGGGK